MKKLRSRIATPGTGDEGQAISNEGLDGKLDRLPRETVDQLVELRALFERGEPNANRSPPEAPQRAD